MSGQPDFTERDGTVRFTGELLLARIGDLPRRLDGVSSGVSTVDLSGVRRIDSVGAWIVHRFAAERGARVEGLGRENQQLFDQVANAAAPIHPRAGPSSSVMRVLGEIGTAIVATGRTLVGLLGFLGATAIAFAGVVRHPRRFRFNAVVQQFEVVGVSALGIVGLMSFLIGLVIAQQGAVQLRQFGAEVFTINLVGRLTLREMGVLMTAIMVAGRSGSAFAAQIGTQKLTEEIDAMRTIGVSPMEALVVPRTMSAIILMPLLGFYSSLIALIGGGLLCWITLGIPPVTFVQRIREVVPITDLYVGLIKAPVFGAIIAIAGCFQGMQVEANAEQVGLRTTAAVVQAIFLVIVLDAFFAVFFTWLGWD
ncbi:phospholipid/cholesterol/gamma-HCH transport system permease protein [Sphingomonas jinjuensis]|uniref:Phospholipid/cholesterol/gamma-HCH transport system permease protein n=1 Tax=Sphingomonas jinjuensis TaxID=535907 RepID=A0A840F4K4_9SPHN|nr:ABC transporter permease [Sphingomonas jinjuensis]MBB4152729.1 phospholipid/cholesterol/gamma-HCH transport system permease protein [Sphingomonas jinjuensis]